MIIYMDKNFVPTQKNMAFMAKEIKENGEIIFSVINNPKKDLEVFLDTVNEFAGNEIPAMIALRIPNDVRDSFEKKYPFLEDKDNLHITLIYLGDARNLSIEAVKLAVQNFADWQSSIKGKLQGFARFVNNEKKDPLVMTFDSHQMPDAYQMLCVCLENENISFHHKHGFTPHMTLAYIPRESDMPIDTVEPIDLNFDSVCLVVGDEWTEFKLLGGINQFANKLDEIVIEMRGAYGRKGIRGGSSNTSTSGSATNYIRTIETQQGVFRNPLDPRSLAFTDGKGNILASVQVSKHWEYDGKESVYFNIYVPEKRKGNGTVVMKKLTSIADQTNTLLVGDVSPFGNEKGMNKKQLMKWYKSLGFVEGNEPGRYGMVFYYPKMESLLSVVDDFINEFDVK